MKKKKTAFGGNKMSAKNQQTLDGENVKRIRDCRGG